MAFSDNSMQLVTVKAVDDSYPLRGEMVLSNGDKTRNHVSENQLWLEPRVMQQLQVNIGDALNLVMPISKVSGEVLQEPGVGV